MKIFAAAIVALVLVVGCSSRPPREYLGQGWVRSLWCQPETAWHLATCTVIFEGDDRSVISLAFVGQQPAVWIGLHGIIRYDEDRDHDGSYKNLQVIARLP